MKRFLWGLAGYLLFAVSAFTLFQLSGVDPHDPPTPLFVVVSMPYGLLFAVVAGWLAVRLSRPPRGAELVVAALMVFSGIASIAAQPGAGAIWSQLTTVFLFAPAALAGGWMARRHTHS